MKGFLVALTFLISIPALSMSSKAPTQTINPASETTAKANSQKKETFEEYKQRIHAMLDRSCKTTSDCADTCMFGGVNKDWLKKHQGKDFMDCEDGCSGWGRTIKCVESVCTNFNSAGEKTQDECND